MANNVPVLRQVGVTDYQSEGFIEREHPPRPHDFLCNEGG